MKAQGKTYKDLVDCVLVCGPPGAGKTTYVRDRAQHGDLILDLDRIFVALTGLNKYDKPNNILPYALTAYDDVVSHLSRDKSNIKCSWVISCSPKKQQREELANLLGAKVVVLDTDPIVCLKHIANDPLRASRRKQWEEIIKKWWTDYEPGELNASTR